jgi:hypothetical protein
MAARNEVRASSYWIDKAGGIYEMLRRGWDLGSCDDVEGFP